MLMLYMYFQLCTARWQSMSEEKRPFVEGHRRDMELYLKMDYLWRLKYYKDESYLRLKQEARRKPIDYYEYHAFEEPDSEDER